LVYDDKADVKVRRGRSPGDAKDAVPLSTGRTLERALRGFAQAIAYGNTDTRDVSLGLKVDGILARIEKKLG
jgi:hypothetical protein